MRYTLAIPLFAFMLSCEPKLSPLFYQHSIAAENTPKIHVMEIKRKDLGNLYKAMPENEVLIMIRPNEFNLILQKLYLCEKGSNPKTK